MAKKKKDDTLWRAIIKDDNGDVTYGPPETRANANKRLADAQSADWNVSGDVEEVK